MTVEAVESKARVESLGLVALDFLDEERRS